MRVLQLYLAMSVASQDVNQGSLIGMAEVGDAERTLWRSLAVCLFKGMVS